MKKIVTFLSNWGAWICLLIVGIIFLGLAIRQGLNDQIEAVQIVQKFEEKKLDSSIIKYWIDSANKLHAIAESFSADNRVKSKYIDSIAKLLKIKTKQIESITVTRAESTIDQGLEKAIEYTEGPCPPETKPLSSISFSYVDTWNSIKGIVYVNSNKDSIHYKGIDTIASVAYWSRSKILGIGIGKQKGFVDYANSNSSVKITGGKRLDLNPPKLRYSLNGSLNFGYVPGLAKPQISVGISIGKKLIEF